MEIKSDRVDLTENRDFGVGRQRGGMQFGIAIRQRIIDLTDLITTPFDTGEESTDYNPLDLFPTGTVGNLRIHKKEMELMGYGDTKTCDRCGKKLYPWETCGICETCFDEVEDQVLHRIPWENQNNTTDDNVVF
jgi:hypothetical protein